jgi:uncharacterized phage-associated protein
MNIFTSEKIEKLGNTIIFFLEKVSDLSKTKILKLLYLLEEAFIERYGSPMLGIDFEVWQTGPVSRDVFVELSSEPLLLQDHIDVECDGKSAVIKPKKNFEDRFFTDSELEMLDFIIDRFGDLSSKQLVNFTHQAGSLWYQIAKEKGYLEAFSSGKLNSSSDKIDFSSLMVKFG